MTILKSVLFLAALSLSSSHSAFAKSDTSKSSDSEMKQKMAAMHEDMAACLRSPKSMKECHSEMMSKGDMGNMGDMCSGMMKNHKGDMSGKMGGMMGQGSNMNGMMSGNATQKK